MYLYIPPAPTLINPHYHYTITGSLPNQPIDRPTVTE